MNALWKSILCSIALGGATAQAAGSGNLLVDGDAEAGRCTMDWHAVSTVPGWTVVRGNPSVVCHAIGSFALPATPAPGAAFFADGPYGDSAMLQSVDVSAATAAIDAGGVGYALSGWLGGWGTYAGKAQVTANFLATDGHALGSAAQLGGDTPAARGNRNAFLTASASGSVPPGTRRIEVQVQFLDSAGSYNIGYADNLSLTLTTPLAAAPLTPPRSQVPAFDHVFIVMMENTDYAAIVGNTHDAPFINSLIARGASLTRYNGVYHPSDQNYIAIAGGDTFVEGAIYYPNIHIAARSIGDEIEAKGKTWKAYEQGMGTPCNTGTQYDHYYMPDDAPFVHFDNILGDYVRCHAHLFDTTQLTQDLKSAATTPNFSWIAANDYYDGEAAGNGSPESVQVQDTWLRQTFQPVLDSPAWKNERSLLIVTWDESSTWDGNHIATVLVGSQGLVRAGASVGESHDHYSTARTIEEALGLAPLTPNDRYAAPINAAFVAPAQAPSLSTATPSVKRGTSIAFAYSTPAAELSAKNWIGIYAAGKVPGAQASLQWAYSAAATGSTSFSTATLAAGTYVAWYCYDDGYTVLAGPVGFTVTP